MEGMDAENNEANEEEDEELLLHDIDDGEDAEIREDFRTLNQHMEAEIENLMDRLEHFMANRQPLKKCISPKRRNNTPSLPQVHPKQKSIAQELLTKIQKSQPEIEKYKYFDFFTVVPMFKSLGKQTVDRFKDFIEDKKQDCSHFFHDVQPDISNSAVDSHVIRNIKGRSTNKSSEENKINVLKERIVKEKEETLFFVVHDEAHFAPIRNCLVDEFINHPKIALAENVIILQVSATPYCLVTENTRVPRENQLNWFTDKNDDSSSNYIGIQDFVDNSIKSESFQQHQETLIPGTMTEDSTFENGIAKKSMFNEKLKDVYKLCNQKKRSSENFPRESRFFGLVYQYILGLIQKAGMTDYLQVICDIHMSLSNATKNMLQDFDKGDNGTGTMILLRVMDKREGYFFTKVLRRIRKILGLETNFSIVLDIDNVEERTSGLDNFTGAESDFLPRLQMWNAAGNKQYRPSGYKDLEDLPVILIVCEKGKMGITYPKSLRYYDLRLRYATTAGVTRGAIEQDFGRACRYRLNYEDELPTILVSKMAYKKLHPRKTRSTISKENTTQGVFTLDPDYSKYMVASSTKSVPSNDFDLIPYFNWKAGYKHSDLGNTTVFKNRYLLVGRPQIGKTGAFLHLAYLIWNHLHQPKYQGPAHEKAPEVIIENDDEEEDEEDLKDEIVVDYEGFGRYPIFDYIKSLTLTKPGVSSRYGDPTNQENFDWYIKHGNKRPFPEFLTEKSTLLRRPQLSNPQLSCKPEQESLVSQTNHDPPQTFMEPRPIKLLNRYSAKSLTLKNMKKQEFSAIVQNNYDCYEVGNLGNLYIMKSAFQHKKWMPRGEETPVINTKFPPILIPSSGRSESALLDLTEAMEGKKDDYVELVFVRDSEKERYFQICQQHFPIDLFVMNKSTAPTIGAARSIAKKVGEVITREAKEKFVFMLDDNILCWSGVTLINDPTPMFDPDPNHSYSQTSNVSFRKVLNYLSENYYGHFKQFAIVGFSGTNRATSRRKNAFGRKHVHKAILINLQITAGVEYNEKAWAMEDMDFNMRTHQLSKYQPDQGVLVKCMRFIAYKKQINAGGVVPEIPDYKTLEVLAAHTLWGDHEEVKMKYLLSQNILQDDFDYESDGSTISVSLLDDEDSNPNVDTITHVLSVSDGQIGNLAIDSNTHCIKEELNNANDNQLIKSKEFSEPAKPEVKGKKIIQKRKKDCGTCSSCHVKDDCGSCKFCKDKPKFGGNSKLRKKCLGKQCKTPIKPAAEETPTTDAKKVRKPKKKMEITDGNSNSILGRMLLLEKQYRELKKENEKKDSAIQKLEKKLEVEKKMRKKANSQLANLRKKIENVKPTLNGATKVKVTKTPLKRKSESEKTIEAAKLGKILPLTLQKEKKGFVCSNQSCKECPLIPEPFDHFVSFFKIKDHVLNCHMCQLYRNDGLLNSMAAEESNGSKKK